MRTMILCQRNEKKIYQKFVLLKVTSDKKFALRPLSKMVPMLFVYEKQIQIVLF